MNETAPQAATSGPADLWWILLAVVVLVVVGLGVYLFFRRRKRRAAARAAAEAAADETAAPPPDVAEASLRASFAAAVARLQALVSGRDYRYQIPWLLLLGEEDAGKTTLLRHVGLAQEHTPRRHRTDTSWWFFEDGVVLDVPGSYFATRRPGETDDRLWLALLRLLEKNRRRRPIDGLVLAIPATDLTGPTRLSPAALEQKARHAYERLLSVQRMLRLRLPVYVVVTKADAVPGFQSYAEEVPEAARDSIFGWSVPYTLPTAFADAWVDQAFREMEQTLYRTQIGVLADGIQSHDPDGFLLFPAAFGALRGPLKHYLSALFQGSAYHDSFFLRGFYFTGDAGPALDPPDPAAAGDGAPLPVAARAAERPPRPIFATHLFRYKVFPEFELARPVSNLFAWRNRTAFAFQVASLAVFVLWSIGLLVAHHRLRHSAHELKPVLCTIAFDLGTHAAGGGHGLDYCTAEAAGLTALDGASATDDELFEQRALALIGGFASLRTQSLFYASIPASWFSPLGEQVEDAFHLAYDRILLRAMRDALEERARDVITRPYFIYTHQPAYVAAAPGVLSAAPFATSLEAQPRFQTWERFVASVVELEGYVNAYNRLPQTGSLDDFQRLVEYLYDYRMPDAFFEHDRLYRDALTKADLQAFDLQRFGAHADDRVRLIVAGLYIDLFRKNVLQRYVDQLRLQLQELGSLESLRTRTLGDAALERIRAILAATDGVEILLGDPSLAYLNGFSPLDTMTFDSAGNIPAYVREHYFTLGPAYTRVLERMDSSRVFTDGLVGSVPLTGRYALLQARKDLLAAQTPLTGPLLTAGATQSITLSPGVAAVRSALARLAGSAQGGPAGEGLPATLLPGQQLTWNVGLLDEAAALPLEPSDSAAAVPQRLQATVHYAEDRLMLDRVARLVAQAAYVEDGDARAYLHPETLLLPRIENFSAAAPSLQRILGLYRSRRALDDARRLRALVGTQARMLLEQVDQLLAYEALYGIRHARLDAWPAGTPLYAVLFDNPDPTVVPAYLAAQRSRMAELAATYAGPMAAYLTSVDAGFGQAPPPSAAAWGETSRALQAAANRVPGNALAGLEAFATAVLHTTSPEACLALAVADTTTALGSDLFARAHRDLRATLQHRCGALALERAAAGYEALAAYFNRHLAGRPPFAAAIRAGEPAEPEAVRRFYARYDTFATASLGVFREAVRQGRIDDAALHFLLDLGRARPVFAAFLDDGKGEYALPVLDLDVRFRVNRAHEVHGDQVIDWRLTTGGRTVRHVDPETTLRWVYGQPVRVAIRLAKDGPLALDAAPGTAAATRTLAFDYDDPWALLSLLRRHEAPAADLGGLPDPAPHTLRFAGEAYRRDGATGPAGEAVVFIQVRVRPPGAPDPIVVPLLPTAAPALAWTDRL